LSHKRKATKAKKEIMPSLSITEMTCGWVGRAAEGRGGMTEEMKEKRRGGCEGEKERSERKRQAGRRKGIGAYAVHERERREWANKNCQCNWPLPLRLVAATRARENGDEHPQWGGSP